MKYCRSVPAYCFVFSVTALLMTDRPAYAQSQVISSEPGYTQTATQPGIVRFYQTDAGVAIDGTDPVSYFRQGKPISGRADFSYSWMGATWRFSSEENRDLFMKNPQQYAPRYGGFCAYAVANGYTAPTVPDAWQIVDGKLYLNFSRGVHRTWQRDVLANIQRAEKNWPQALNTFRSR
jgi:YHS domain-containing protein